MDKFVFDEATSSAKTGQQDTVGSLLTKGGMVDGIDSATARHEDEAKRNPNGSTAEKADKNEFGEDNQIKQRVTLADVAKDIFAGGDVPKDRFSEHKTEEYSVPIYANAEKDEGLYGYTDKARVFEESITVAARGTIGFCARRYEPYLPVVRLISVIPNQEIVKTDYLYYALKGLNAKGSGTSIPQLTVPDVKKYTFNLVPFKEQESIVEILDNVNNLISLRKKQLDELDTLIKSRFIEMFGDASDDQMTTMEDVCKIITDGTHQPPKFEATGVPFLFVSNIVSNEITYDAEKFISEDTYNGLIKRTPIEVGDVLLSTVGSYGHPAVVKETRTFCFQRHIAYLKPNAAKINSVYLHGAILSDDVQRQIDERVKGIAQKTLNLSEIRKLRLPLPPMKLQEQFATFVQATDKSKSAIQKSLNELQTLFDSLMQEYFG